MMREFNIDIERIPFSRYGAYLGVTAEGDGKRLIIHNAHRRFEEAPAFSICFLKSGIEVQNEISASPECIYIRAGGGSARIYLRDDETLVLETKELTTVFTQLSVDSYGGDTGYGGFEIISVDQHCYYLFNVLEGKGTLRDRDGKKDGHRRQVLEVNGDHCLLALRVTSKEPEIFSPVIEPENELAICTMEWQEFIQGVPDADQLDSYELVTWYNLWSSFARARDTYCYDTMMMSKKYMSSVWSWDHCFNALAMARIDRKIALEQFLAPFAVQCENGALPDMWNPETETIWAVTKPPIHGWCFGKLMDQFAFSQEELGTVYVYLEKWTNWWINYRDSDHDGIPDYPQGCDSGWDNATLFDIGYFLESPDLPAFLILQMQTLARIAENLSGEIWKKRAAEWMERAAELKERFYAHSWNGSRFVAKVSWTHEFEEEPTCLLSLMPLVLGEQLEAEKRTKLITILKRDFLTEHGLATESPASLKYESDGYWRGPIWAPSTYLIVDGLRRSGEGELADVISRRFCHMAREVAHGNYENYDALHGNGWRAPGYTWTASVYFLLKWEMDR